MFVSLLCLFVFERLERAQISTENLAVLSCKKKKKYSDSTYTHKSIGKNFYTYLFTHSHNAKNKSDNNIEGKKFPNNSNTEAMC